MDTIAISVIVIYLVASTTIGSVMARRTKTSTGWAVAGGKMPALMLAAGVAGTRIGGAGTYGVAGEVITGGIWNLWWYAISSFLALAIVGLFFAVYYRRFRLQTVGELFTLRWGNRRCQWVTSLCVQTEYVIVNLIEAYVIGVIISTLTPFSMSTGVIVSAVIFSTYVSLGGLWGTAVTNLIHCGVVLLGLLSVGLIGIGQFGGWTGVTEAIHQQLATTSHNEIAWWGFVGAGWLPVFAMIFSAAIHTPAASVYTNYAAAAHNERLIPSAFIVAGIIAALMPLLAGLIGVLTTAQYGVDAGLGGYRNLTMLASDISPVVGGIALAAVLAAVISSGGPILLSSVTMFVRDWLPFTEHYDETRKLRTYQVTTIVYAFVAAALAWLVATKTNISILDLLLFGFAMVVPPAIAVGYLIYWRRTTECGAYWGIVIGYGAGMAWFGLIKLALSMNWTAPDGAGTLHRIFVYCFTANGEGIDPSYVTTIVPLILIPVVSLLTTDREGNSEVFYEILSGKRINDLELES